jgi:ATP-dependent Lhr-like helicase
VQFDRCIDLVATGGYALRVYERYRRIVQDQRTGRWRARNATVAQQHRMNVGAIVESEMLDVRLAHRAGDRARPGVPKSEGPRPLVAGRRLGQIEEYCIEGLAPGDTFLFAGEILRLVGVQERDALVVRAAGQENPSIPSYAGGKFPLSTFLADRVRHMLHDPKRQKSLPPQVREWIKIQKRRSIVPAPNEMLLETFPRAQKHYLV